MAVVGPSWYRWREKSLRLEVQLAPRSGKEAIEGIHDGRLRIRITAAPVEGKANQALLALLAREFGVSKRAVQIVGGVKSRRKTVQINAPERVPPWFQSLSNRP